MIEDLRPFHAFEFRGQQFLFDANSNYIFAIDGATAPPASGDRYVQSAKREA
jgi:hypothetical protein